MELQTTNNHNRQRKDLCTITLANGPVVINHARRKTKLEKKKEAAQRYADAARPPARDITKSIELENFILNFILN